MNALIYGLSWSLPFATPELPVAENTSEVNVVPGKFDERSISWRTHGVCYKAAPGAYFLAVPGVASFLVTNGNQIVIDAQAHVPEQEILHFLFNPVAGALLMQRGILPLQASAVAKDGKAAILLGVSAAGKSLLAAGLMQQGFKVLTDAICAVHPGAKPIVKAGYPHLLLWNRALKELKFDSTALCKLRQNNEKYQLPVHNDAYAFEAIAERVYLLSDNNENQYRETLTVGQQKFALLLDHIYHNPLIEALGMQKEMYRIMISLAQLCPLTKVDSLSHRGNAREFIDMFASRY
ncbi:MAG: hypothetical protein PHQ60_09170 [Sideroxydans sp.]|nr:hypothetical protein [Sideroxydans sp.]